MNVYTFLVEMTVVNLEMYPQIIIATCIICQKINILTAAHLLLSFDVSSSNQGK